MNLAEEGGFPDQRKLSYEELDNLTEYLEGSQPGFEFLPEPDFEAEIKE